LSLTIVQRDECEMNGSWQAAQKPAHAIGTVSRRQKIDADGVAFAGMPRRKKSARRPRHGGRRERI
jgi:hypothetical protein